MMRGFPGFLLAGKKINNNNFISGLMKDFFLFFVCVQMKRSRHDSGGEWREFMITARDPQERAAGRSVCRATPPPAGQMDTHTHKRAHTHTHTNEGHTDEGHTHRTHKGTYTHK